MEEKTKALVKLQDESGQEIDEAKFNILAPMVHRIENELFTMSVSSVRLSSKPEDGDVYVQQREIRDREGGVSETRLTPAKGGLLKIAQAMNLRITKSAPIERGVEEGEGGRRFPWAIWQVVGSARSIDGSERELMATYEFNSLTRFQDLVADSKAVIYRALKEGKAWAKSEFGGKEDRAIHEAALRKADFKVRPLVNHYLRRAESGAMMALIRLFANIKGEYSEAELKKPFACPRIDLNLSNPEVRERVARGIESHSAALYPERAIEGPRAAPAAVEEVEAQVVEDPVVEARRRDLVAFVNSLEEVLVPESEKKIFRDRVNIIDLEGLKKIREKLEKEIEDRKTIIEKEKEEAELPDWMKEGGQK